MVKPGCTSRDTGAREVLQRGAADLNRLFSLLSFSR